MAVFSYHFFALWLITLFLYYTVFKKRQWELLTLASLYFYIVSVDRIPFVLFLVWLISYFGAKFINDNRVTAIKAKRILVVCIVMSVLALFAGRNSTLIAVLGNSYFVLKAIGYDIDVWRETDYEDNIFRYLLFLIYWPGILEGPFNRIYDFKKDINKEKSFDYITFCHGIQRFLFGVFKKLVVAERCEIITSAILDEPSEKGGIILIIGVVAFAIQTYTDFSGFIDMMLGISSSFGIILPENFRQPYFAKSIPEFWRRWHITLGLWFRDYVMFPITTSKTIKNISRMMRKRNKRVGRLFPMLLGTCLVWALTGIWHGTGINYLLWGGYYAVLMCLSMVFSDLFSCRDRRNNLLRSIFENIKTVVLVLIADTIICVPNVSKLGALWKELVFNLNKWDKSTYLAINLEKTDYLVLLVGCIVIIVISALKEKGICIYNKIDNAPLVLRWGLYYSLVFSILLLGLYGGQYDASQFLYMQF